MKLCINHFASDHRRDGAVRRNPARAGSSESRPVKILGFADFFSDKQLYDDLKLLNVSVEPGIQIDASMFSDFEKRLACIVASDELLGGRFTPSESESNEAPFELRAAVEQVVLNRLQHAVAKYVSRLRPATVLPPGLAGWWTVIEGIRVLVERGWHHIAVANFVGEFHGELSQGETIGYFGQHFHDPAEFRVITNLLSHPSGKVTSENPFYESAALLRKLAAIRDADIMTVTDRSTAIPFLLEEDLIVVSKNNDVWDRTDGLIDRMTEAVSCEASTMDVYDLRDGEAKIRRMGVRLVAHEASFVLADYPFFDLGRDLDQCRLGLVPCNSARQAVVKMALQLAPAMLSPADRKPVALKIQEALKAHQFDGFADSEIVALLCSAASRWTSFCNPQNPAYLVHDANRNSDQPSMELTDATVAVAS